MDRDRPAQDLLHHGQVLAVVVGLEQGVALQETENWDMYNFAVSVGTRGVTFVAHCIDVVV